MKRFNALKKVNATPMTRQAYNDYRGWTLPEDENGDDEGYLTEDIDGPINTDEFMGYVSWTPKAMFDDQFYECTAGQTGGLPVKCTAPSDPEHELTEDEFATLASNGSLCDCADLPRNIFQQEFIPNERDDSDIKFDFGSAIYLLQSGKNVMRQGWNGKGMHIFYIVQSDFNDLDESGGLKKVHHLGYLALKTASGDVVPWTISQSDALATDWCLA